MELPFEHKRLQDFYKPLPDSEGGVGSTPHPLGGEDSFGIHTADEFVNHKKSKMCTILW